VNGRLDEGLRRYQGLIQDIESRRWAKTRRDKSGGAAFTRFPFASVRSRSPASACSSPSVPSSALWLFSRELKRSGLPGDAVDAGVAGVVGGLAGAKGPVGIRTSGSLTISWNSRGIEAFAGAR
jgi:hypothetical protein